MTTRQAEGLVRRLREQPSDEARRALLSDWPTVAQPAASSSRDRPRSEREQLLADVTTLERVGVRLEVRLLEMPLQTESTESLRRALGELDELLETLGKAVKRALAQQEKGDATLAQP